MSDSVVQNKANSVGRPPGERGRPLDFVLPWGRLPAGGTDLPTPLNRLFSCPCPNGGTPKAMAPCEPKPRFLAAPAQNATWTAGCQVADGRKPRFRGRQGGRSRGQRLCIWHVARGILDSSLKNAGARTAPAGTTAELACDRNNNIAPAQGKRSVPEPSSDPLAEAEGDGEVGGAVAQAELEHGVQAQVGAELVGADQQD